MADLNKLTESNQSNPQSGSVSSGNTTEEELVKSLSEEKLECPYPEDKLYLEVRNKYEDQPDQQKWMMKNIGPMIDGKREIIPMKKKFSMLTAQHNGKDIFDGSHTDKNGKIGIKGVTYLTCRAAEDECKKQGKKLLENQSEVEQFIDYFPGENRKEKIFNFVTLFSLEKAGYWGPNLKRWFVVGSVGGVILSRVNRDDDVYGVGWYIDNANIYRYNHECPYPFLTSESLD